MQISWSHLACILPQQLPHPAAQLLQARNAPCNTAVFVRRPVLHSSLPPSLFCVGGMASSFRLGRQHMPILLQRGSPLYLFATCSVQSALKFRRPLLASVCWLSADRVLPATGYEICQQLYICQLLRTSLHTFLILFSTCCGMEGRSFFLQKRPVSFVSLSLFQFSYWFSFFSPIRLLQFLERSRCGTQHPGGAIYLPQPQRRRARCCVR